MKKRVVTCIIGIGVLIAFLIIGIYKFTEKIPNVYQKLISGEEINILIVGDSIGAPSGEDAWSTLLREYLEKQYGSAVTINNISMGGNTSYAGYVRIMMLDDKEDYDLAVICYGENDSEDKFSLYYENIYKAIQEKFPDCSMISILESSQREYTYKMQSIIELAEYYKVPVADTIAAFNHSEVGYELLTEDGVHPNAEGHKLYFETVKDVVESQMNQYETSGKRINKETESFNNTITYAVDEFKRIDDCIFETRVKKGKGLIGLFYDYVPGKNKIEIYSNNSLLEKVEFEWSYGFQQEHIDLLQNEYEFGNKIKIVFSNKEQADSFQGVCISYFDEK